MTETLDPKVDTEMTEHLGYDRHDWPAGATATLAAVPGRS
ncbi:hypothetical protein BKP42_66840 [Rhodococcus erythropolis]|nr:hypothetical protein BKP42_66840 [Rhodococcus erythropolis]